MAASAPLRRGTHRTMRKALKSSQRGERSLFDIVDAIDVIGGFSGRTTLSVGRTDEFRLLTLPIAK